MMDLITVGNCIEDGDDSYCGVDALPFICLFGSTPIVTSCLCDADYNIIGTGNDTCFGKQ